MTEKIELHILAAERATQLGDRSAAISAWRAVLDLQADHPVALNVLGNWELAQGNAKAAQGYLQRAVAADPGQPALLFNLAAAARAAGDLAGALTALEESLAVDPEFVQAMFQMAIVYEEIGQPRSAAQVYRNFLDTAPPEILANPKFAEPIGRARAAIEADNLGLESRITADNPPPSVRASEAADALLGKHRIYVSEPTFLTVPRLPAIPFLARAQTPWFATLEAATAAITAEARRVMKSSSDDMFVPYVANPTGTPLNQWGELDHSNRWAAFFLWKHGVRNDANCALCPETAKALQSAPLAGLEGRAPNAFFSRLEPQTRIPPHTGVTNARLTVHLPLIVPKGCGFRVGAETREWQPGVAWVFDDTIEHEAWNDSDEPRLILIFDIWHPMLAPEERSFFTKLLAGYDAHYGQRQGLTDTL